MASRNSPDSIRPEKEPRAALLRNGFLKRHPLLRRLEAGRISVISLGHTASSPAGTYSPRGAGIPLGIKEELLQAREQETGPGGPGLPEGPFHDRKEKYTFSPSNFRSFWVTVPLSSMRSIVLEYFMCRC